MAVSGVPNVMRTGVKRQRVSSSEDEQTQSPRTSPKLRLSSATTPSLTNFDICILWTCL